MLDIENCYSFQLFYILNAQKNYIIVKLSLSIFYKFLIVKQDFNECIEC